MCIASAYDRRQFGADFRAIHLPEIYEMIRGPRKTLFYGERCLHSIENHESGSLFCLFRYLKIKRKDTASCSAFFSIHNLSCRIAFYAEQCAAERPDQQAGAEITDAVNDIKDESGSDPRQHSLKIQTEKDGLCGGVQNTEEQAMEGTDQGIDHGCDTLGHIPREQHGNRPEDRPDIYIGTHHVAKPEKRPVSST